MKLKTKINVVLLSLNKQYLAFLLCSIISIQLNAQVITSPDKNFSLTFELNDAGVPAYQLSFKEMPVIKRSSLGLELVGGPPLMEGFTVTNTEQNTVDETWNPVWGEQKVIRNNYNELLVTLTQKTKNERSVKLRFRLFNDGLG